jgi:peptidoglycan-associated lipoprotein
MEKNMRDILKIIILGAMVTLLAGCPTSPVKPEGATVENRDLTKQSDVVKDGADTKTTTDDKISESVLTDPKSILSKRSIYFEYDKYDIQDKYKSLVEAHARFLVAHPDRKVLIQGNTDERGSREYNLALGQRRADAAKKALSLLGAREAQIEAVSLGEEKPRAPGKDEASYAENRRDDILYNGE